MIAAVGLTRRVSLPGRQSLDILRGVDFTVRRGESVAILGRSGSGKSTLLAIMGLLSPVTEGSLALLGTDVTRVSDSSRARLRNKHIGFVFQSYSLVRHLSAAANVALPLLYGAHVGRRERRRRASEALDLVGLAERERSRSRQLSGGEQQRVAIARALVRQPSLVLADEPTGALDVDTGRQVLDVMLRAARDRQAALVVVTHDPQIAAMMSRRVQLLDGVLREDA